MSGVLENELRWQSRRGTLELDLVLEKFWQKPGGAVEEELRGLGELLAMDDEELRRVLRGGGEHLTPAAQKTAAILREL